MKCPNCGAGITKDLCEYCGTKFDGGKAENNSYQPFTSYNYNYYYTNAQRQPFAANTGKYTNRPAPPPAPGYQYNSYGQYSKSRDYDRSEKSIIVCLILCATVGYLGIHRFYTGRIFTGLIYLFTFGLFGFGAFTDLVLIACGYFRDRRGRRLRW